MLAEHALELGRSREGCGPMNGYRILMPCFNRRGIPNRNPRMVEE